MCVPIQIKENQCGTNQILSKESAARISQRKRPRQGSGKGLLARSRRALAKRRRRPAAAEPVVPPIPDGPVPLEPNPEQAVVVAPRAPAPHHRGHKSCHCSADFKMVYCLTCGTVVGRYSWCHRNQWRKDCWKMQLWHEGAWGICVPSQSIRRCSVLSEIQCINWCREKKTACDCSYVP